MICIFGQFEFNMNSIFYTHFHNSWYLWKISLFLRDANSELFFSNYRSDDIPSEWGSDKISDSSGWPSEALIIFIEIGKFKAECFAGM